MTGAGHGGGLAATRATLLLCEVGSVQPFIFLLIGLAAGVLSGLFGIGGGVVIVPALLFLVRMPVQTATGTSLAALLLPVGALGAWAYYRMGHLDLSAATWIAGGLFVAAVRHVPRRHRRAAVDVGVSAGIVHHASVVPLGPRTVTRTDRERWRSP